MIGPMDPERATALADWQEANPTLCPVDFTLWADHTSDCVRACMDDIRDGRWLMALHLAV